MTKLGQLKATYDAAAADYAAADYADYAYQDELKKTQKETK
jgi:hypothetical protein